MTKKNNAKKKHKKKEKGIKISYLYGMLNVG